MPNPAGIFLITDATGTHSASTVTGEDARFATWQAPTDLAAGTPNAVIKCRIDDLPRTIAAGESGNRDDAPAVERVIRVRLSLPRLSFTGLPRACAGGIGDDGVHSFSLQVHASGADGSPLASTPLEVFFKGNTGHNYGSTEVPDIRKRTQLWDPVAQQWKDPAATQTLTPVTLTTNQRGDLVLKVMSGDLISHPKIMVRWNGILVDNLELRKTEGDSYTKVDGVVCDFGAVESLRNFPNQYDPDEAEDTGWLFWFPNLVNPNGTHTTPAKAYLKFMVDSSIGDKKGNWKVVNGHQLLVKVESVELHEGSPAFSGNLKDYAFVVDPDHPQATTRIVTTSDDGGAQSLVQGGVRIQYVENILVTAEDRSQWAK